MKILKALEIIEETIEYYKTDPNRRAITQDGSCEYNTDDGRHCAIGRCLSKKYKDEGHLLYGNDGGIDTLLEDNRCNSLDEMLMPRYKGHPFEFWSRLQTFHDREKNWDENGLTESGSDHINELKSFYYDLGDIKYDIQDEYHSIKNV